jgi:hypothetical protein
MLGRHPSLQVGNAAPGSAIFSDYIMLADRVRVDVDFGGYRLEDTRWSGRTAQFVRPQTIASARQSTHTSVVLLNEEAEEVGTGAGRVRSSASHFWRPTFSACSPRCLLMGDHLAGSTLPQPGAMAHFGIVSAPTTFAKLAEKQYSLFSRRLYRTPSSILD